MSDYPWNKKNITFTWLSSFYNPFNLISWPSLNHKKLLQCVNTSSFLSTNLSYKKGKTVMIAQLIYF